MLNLQEKLKSADSDILSEIIESCETAMISPFAKSKPAETPEPVEAKAETTDDTLENADLDELVTMYQSLKD